jgi:hypothetical protein
MSDGETGVFFSDEPIESVDQDKFGHQEYVDTLEQILREARPKWNIGVFGEWGSGKSSIINLLFNRLEDHSDFDDTICVNFDAWSHAEGSIRTDLLLGINSKLGEKAGLTNGEGEYGVLDEDYITRELYDIIGKKDSEDVSLKEYVVRFFSQSVFVTVVTGLTALIILIIMVANILSALGFWGPNPNLLGSINSILQAAIFPLFLGLFIFMAKQVEETTTELQQQRPRKEWSGAYEHLFQEMIDKLVHETNNERVVISIDNLDRCESETAYNVLISLKTFMEDERCIYIVPCDDDALISHVKSIDEGEYLEDEENDREFIRKLFQAHVRVTPFTDEDILEYSKELNQELEESYDDEVISVVSKAYSRNPRRIKQALNRLTTLRMLAEEMEQTNRLRKGSITGNLPFLAKISILQEDYPDFYNALQNKPHLLNGFNNYHLGRISDEEYKEELSDFFDTDVGTQDPSGGLEAFLWSTRYVTDSNPRQFIHLNEPSYILDLEDEKRLVEDIRAGDLKKVRDKLNTIDDREYVPYLNAIQDSLESSAHIKPELFGIIDGLMEVFDAFDEKSQSQLAEYVSDYLVQRREEFLGNLNPETAFPMIIKMQHNDSTTLFDEYAGLVSNGQILRGNILQEFVNYSRKIPETAVDTLSESLTELGRSDAADEFKTALDSIHESTSARQNLVTPELLREAVRLVELDSGQGYIDNEYYEKFDEESDPDVRGYYVSEMIDLQDTVSSDNQGQAYRYLSERLLAIENDISSEAANELYDNYKSLVESPDSNERELVKALFYYYNELESGDKEDFRKKCMNQLKSYNGTTQKYLEWAREYDVQLLSSEEDVRKALRIFPDNSSNPQFLTDTVLPLIPEEFDDEVTSKKIFDLLDLDDSDAELGAYMFSAYPERFDDSSQEIAAKCLDKSESVDMNNKEEYLEAVLNVFAELDNSDQERFLSQLTGLARGNDKNKASFKRLYHEVEDELNQEHRRKIARDLFDAIKNEASGQSQRQMSDKLISVVDDLVDDLPDNEHQEFIERMSSRLTDENLDRGRKEMILKYLTEIDTLGGQGELVLDRLEAMLKQNSAKNLHRSVEGRLNKLKQKNGIDEEKVDEIREEHLET